MNFSSKEKKIHKAGQKQAKQAGYESYVETGGAVKTWSATHKPYYAARTTVPLIQNKPGN